MPSPFNPLDYSLGDLHSSPSLYSSSSSTTTSRPKTFTRVARGVPANNSSASLFPTPSPKSSPSYSSSSTATTTTTTTSSPSYFSLSNSSLSPSECTANNNNNNNKSTPIYSSGNNITTASTKGEQKHSQQQQQQHGLNRFRPSLYTSSSYKTDFLEDIPSIVDTQSSSSSSFTALRHVDRKDLLQLHLDPSLVLLSQDELAKKHVASAPSSSSSLSRYSPFNNTKDTTDSPVDDNNNNKAVSKPCPTFTRITKPRTTTPAPATGARTGFYRLGDLGNTNKGNAAGIDLLGGGSYSSLLHQEEEDKKGTMPSLSLSTSSPSSSCVPSPWSPPPPQPPPPTTTSFSLSSSSTLLSSSNNIKPSQSQSLKAPTLLLSPLSLSLSPPPSSVPSLSSSASSACSSASSSSSPPTSHFLFPTVDHHDWWQGLGSSPVAPPSVELEQGGEGGTGSRTEPLGTGSGSSLTTLEDRSLQDDVLTPATITTPSSHTFYRQQPQSRDKLNKSDDLFLDKDPVVDHLALTPAGSAALNLNNNDNQNKDNSSNNGPSGGMNGPYPAGTVKTAPSTRKTYSLARTRVPPPPCVITGFCSISKTPIKPSGEPSPQDFLGEADLPYPLPSTLHDRQTRQRKRAEQLRQLKIREECEAQEKTDSMNNNRRRAIRRRVNSYSAGMMYSPASSSASSASTSSTSQHALSPPPSSSINSNSTPNSPAMFSDFPRMDSQSQQSSAACFRSAAWHQQPFSLNQHLKRSPSSPARGSSSANNLHLLNRHSTCNIGQSSKDKLAMLSELSTPPSRPRRKVAFDLENIQVFEYDVSGGDDWSPSSESGPSSPTMPPASTNGRDSYVRYCPPSDCSSSSGSSDEESSSPRPPRVPTPTRDLKSKASS